MSTANVLVLGAGANGLSSAVRIQEMCGSGNVNVTVMADKFSPNTTSDGAGGFWEVFSVGESDPELIHALSKETYDHMVGLARSPLASVVRAQLVSGWNLWNKKIEPELDLKDVVDGYRPLTAEEIARVPGAKDGRFFTTVTLDVTPYLRWLTDRFKANGGRLFQRKIRSLEELSDDWDVVVNCTSWGSYQLLGDHKVYPLRGQVFRVEAPWLKHFCVREEFNGAIYTPTYILPNVDSVVVGGISQRGNWNQSVEEEDSKDIWERAVNMMPSLKGAKILKQWAGLRPCRETLRLETELMKIGQNKKEVPVVHNYGHGGAGITLHWGCARKTAVMVADVLKDKGLHTVNKSKL